MYHVINLDAAECCIILQYYFICVQGAPDNYNNALEQDFNNLEARSDKDNCDIMLTSDIIYVQYLGHYDNM